MSVAVQKLTSGVQQPLEVAVVCETYECLRMGLPAAPWHRISIACQARSVLSRMIDMHMRQQEHHACLLCAGLHRASLSHADIQQFVPRCNPLMPQNDIPGGANGGSPARQRCIGKMWQAHMTPKHSPEWPSRTPQAVLGQAVCSAAALLCPMGGSRQWLSHCCLTWQTAVNCGCPRALLQHATWQLACLPKALHEHPARRGALLPCLAAQPQKTSENACNSNKLSLARHPVKECEVRVQN